MSEKMPDVIVIHETVRESLIRDAGTFGLVVAVIGTGALLNSNAMQWLGFVMLVLVLTGRMAYRSKESRMTPQAAADFLLKRFGVRAGE